MNLSTIFTKENITFILAVIGSLGTIISTVNAFIRNHKSISFKISKLYSYGNSILLYVIIENQSRLPISINGISLINSENLIFTPEISKKVIEITTKEHNEITNKKEFFTIKFPVFIPELGCVGGYLYFDIPQELSQNLPTQLSFQVHTNRGVIKKMKLSYELAKSLGDMY